MQYFMKKINCTPLAVFLLLCAGCGQLGGIQYMIPQLKDTYTMGTSLEFDAELVKKYNIDLSLIHTIQDVEPALKIIAENEPDVVPFISSGSSTGYAQLLSGYDNLIDTLGVLNMQANDSLTVVNWYETPEFMELAKRKGTDLNNSSGIVEIQLKGQPQLLTSYQAGLEGVCLSSKCTNPQKAMQFLNLLYTDPPLWGLYLTFLLSAGKFPCAVPL